MVSRILRTNVFLSLNSPCFIYKFLSIRFRSHLECFQFGPLLHNVFKDRIESFPFGLCLLTGCLPRTNGFSRRTVFPQFVRIAIRRETREHSVKVSARVSYRSIPHLVHLDICLLPSDILLCGCDPHLCLRNSVKRLSFT